MHVFRDIATERQARIADIAIVKDKIKPVTAKIEFKPGYVLLEGPVVEHHDLAVFIDGDLDVQTVEFIHAINKVRQVSDRRAIRYLGEFVSHLHDYKRFLPEDQSSFAIHT